MDFVGIILGGLAYRIRGGMLDDILGRELPNGLIRAVWCLYVTLSLPISYLSPFVFVLAYAGVFPGYWGGQFDLTKEENHTWRNYSILSARGAWLMLPLCLTFYPLYPQLLPSVIAGAFMPLWYLVGCCLPERKGVISHSQIGEWIIGLTIGGTLWISLHN